MPMKARIAQSCALLNKAKDCAIGAFIGIHGRPKGGGGVIIICSSGIN
jgi:hypothetical protein